jgi:hypothetical protein
LIPRSEPRMLSRRVELANLKKLVAVLLAICMASCVFRRLEIQSVDTRAPVTVSTAVKAHLKDGSTVVYPQGVTVTADALEGRGTKYDLTLTTGTRVERIPLTDVLGMESYRTRVNAGTTAVVTTLATAGAVFGGALLAVAIFGSCPTVYSSDGRAEEGELFSSSIAPLFEGRDIDRLQARADPAGIVSLEIRNEAMETHYINHLQLLEVQHQDDEVVVPDARGVPVVLRNVSRLAAVTSRDGHDITELVARSDGRFYMTDRAVLERARADDMDDWIDVEVPVDEHATSAALVFRSRNSLLSTTLLYDVMLGPTGAAALDWLGEGLATISTAVELGRWHERRAGLHVAVWRDGGYREVARVPDSGPISWHDVAAIIPVPAGDTRLRVRLSFLADYWRIDRLGVTFSTHTAVPRIIPLSVVTAGGGAPEAEALAHMRTSDETYLQTNPGQKFVARFSVGPPPVGASRTFFLASQGYYTEWIRGSWIQNATVTQPFMPSDESILAAMRKWGATRESFEERFRSARVPVR